MINLSIVCRYRVSAKKMCFPNVFFIKYINNDITWPYSCQYLRPIKKQRLFFPDAEKL